MDASKMSGRNAAYSLMTCVNPAGMKPFEAGLIGLDRAGSADQVPAQRIESLCSTISVARRAAHRSARAVPTALNRVIWS